MIEVLTLIYMVLGVCISNYDAVLERYETARDNLAEPTVLETIRRSFVTTLLWPLHYTSVVERVTTMRKQVREGSNS